MAQAFGADVDLGNLRLGRHERLVGEVRAEQQQNVALVHRLVCGAPAQQAAHADRIGIVVLDPFLAPEVITHRCLELFCQGHDLVMRAGAAAAWR